MITSLTYIQLLESPHLFSLVTSWKELFPEVFQNYPSDSLRETLSLAGMDQTSHILLSLQDNQLIGSLCYKFSEDPALYSHKLPPGSLFFYNLFVLPKFQRQGKAHELLQKIEGDHPQKKITLMVLAQNDKAIRLYVKEDYRVRRALEHGFLMEKNLTKSILE